MAKKVYQYEVPGTIVKCESGRFLAFYEHRTDIIASGENEKDAKNNLKRLYNIVKKNEAKDTKEMPVKLPPKTQTKSFHEKLERI